MSLGAHGCPLGAETDSCSTGCCGDPANCRYVARAGGPAYKKTEEADRLPNFDPWLSSPTDRDTE
jgi:hypothetical protein